MIQRIDHVSIAVRDYDKALAFFTRILGAIPGSSAQDDHMRYVWQINSLGDLSRLELISPTGAGSFLDGFLKNRAGGVHHITLQTPDIHHARKVLEENGIPYFGYNEYPGGVWKEIFIHPTHAFGVLIQIAEFTADDWLSDSVRMPAGKKFQVEKTGAGCKLTLAHPGGGTMTCDLSPQETTELIESLTHTFSPKA